MVRTHQQQLDYTKAYYYTHKEENKPRRKEYYIKFREKIKLQVLNHYGTVCQCCGQREINFLTIHHINGRGKKIKYEDKCSGLVFWIWLVKNNFPKGYEVLCYKCNCTIKNAKKEYCIVHHPELYNQSKIPPLTKHYLRFQRLKFQQRRKLVIEHYGGKCKCCGENHYEFLTMDHVKTNNNGLYGERLYRYLIRNNFPEGYQVLCWDCNTLKSDQPQELCYIHHPEFYESKPNQII